MTQPSLNEQKREMKGFKGLMDRLLINYFKIRFVSQIEESPEAAIAQVSAAKPISSIGDVVPLQDQQSVSVGGRQSMAMADTQPNKNRRHRKLADSDTPVSKQVSFGCSNPSSPMLPSQSNNNEFPQLHQISTLEELLSLPQSGRISRQRPRVRFEQVAAPAKNPPALTKPPVKRIKNSIPEFSMQGDNKRSQVAGPQIYPISPLRKKWSKGLLQSRSTTSQGNLGKAGQSSSEGGSSAKQHKVRQWLSFEQRNLLETEFSNDPHWPTAKMAELSNQLNMPHLKIYKWHHNRIQKERERLQQRTI